MAWYDYLSPAYDIGAGYGKLTGNGNPLSSLSPSSLVGDAKGLVTPATVDTSSGTAAIANSAGLQSQFGDLAKSFKGAYDPTQVANNTANQNANIQQLMRQANGTAPSAAELQLQQQGNKNAANAFGIGAALQGRDPGAALRASLGASTATQATTNAQAAQMRAQEQAAGQTALAGALSGMQGQQVTLRGQDLNNLQSLYGNQLTASGQQVSGAGNLMNAQAQAASSANAMKGAELNAAGGIAAKLASDPREKKDVHAVGDAGLMKLAEALPAYGYEYKHPGEPGEAPGARGGVMASDVIKGGAGGMVKTDAFGKLNLDVGNAVGTALAMSAAALRRTKGRGGMVKGEAFKKAA